VTVTPQPGPGDRLLVLDISDPASPRLVGECPTHSYSWGKIAVGNQHLYVGGFALSVINIADPVNPQQVGEYRGLFGEMWSTLSVLGIWADRAYVVRGRDLFEVLDLSDPARPQAIGKWDTTQYESVIVSGTVTGNLVYVLADTRLEIYSSGPLVQIPPTSIQALAGGEFGFRISSEQGQHVEVQASGDAGVGGVHAAGVQLVVAAACNEAIWGGGQRARPACFAAAPGSAGTSGAFPGTADLRTATTTTRISGTTVSGSVLSWPQLNPAGRD
jgi:hypothetical protein